MQIDNNNYITNRNFLRKYFKLLDNLSFQSNPNNNVWFGSDYKNNNVICKTLSDYNESDVQLVQEHINHDNHNSISLELQEESNNILFLDIDNHDNTPESKVMNVIVLLKQEFNNNKNCNPCFIERNKITGSVHLAFKFKHKISKQNKIEFVNYFKKKYNKYFDRYKLNLEILHHCRIPLSIDYEFIRYNRNDKGKNYYIRYNNNDLIKVLDFYLSKFNSQKLPNHIILHQKYNKKNIVPEKNYYYKTFTKNSINHEYIDFSKHNLNMGLHKRHHNHIKLGFFCMHNRMSYDEFEKYSSSYNTGSRDLTNNFHKTCESVWNFCQKEFKPYSLYKSNSCVDNDIIVKDLRFKNDIHINTSNYDRTICDNVFTESEEFRLKELIDFIVEKEYKYLKTKKKKKKEFYVVIKELYCKQLYNELNDKQMIQGYEFLSNCVSVGRYYLRKLAKLLHIRNIEYIIKLIIKYVIGKIKKIKNKIYYMSFPDYNYATHIMLMPISMVWNNYCNCKMQC